MLKTYIKVMKALSDPNRIKIIKMLETKDMCVCEMRAALKLAQPSVSKHMKILEDAGLVESSKNGMWVNYRLQAEPENPYAGDLLGLLGNWLHDDDEIQSLIKQAGIINRCEITGRTP